MTSPVATAQSFRRRLCIANSTALPTKFKAVKPVGDRVFVRVDKEEAKTIGGVLLPSVAQKKPNAGSIIALGDASLVKMGDRVIYSKYAGTEISIGGAEHVLLKEDDVIGVLSASDKISQLKPLGDRVLIQNDKAQDKTLGGVLLATDSGDKPTFGKVVAVGAGRKKEDSDEIMVPNVKPGQVVMYSKYSGTEFEDEDSDFIVVREQDILAALA